MAGKTVQPWSAAAWALAARQHGVVARKQLLVTVDAAGIVRDVQLEKSGDW